MRNMENVSFFGSKISIESEGIELINPKEVGVFGAACFHAGARELWSRQVPILECSSFGIQASEVPAARREPHCPVRAEVDAVRETSRKRQQEIFKFPRLWIEHKQFVLRTINLRNG